MIGKLHSVAGGLTVALALGVGACHGNDATTGTASAPRRVTPMPGGMDVASAPAHTLAEGPDICFRLVAKKLGAAAKISELTSFFSVGSDIDSSAGEPKGKMTTCSVQYQNPQDARKLLETSLDMHSGDFSEPRPVEISIMGGDAEKFRLEDYLMSLSQINAAALTSIMESQKARLDGAYMPYAWSGVRLEAPDAFSATHTLRLDVDGRLAANDVKKGGYASITTDGKTIKTNFLLP